MPRYIPGAACWWPMTPKPPVIGAAASDAQVAVGVYWYIPAGQDTLAEPPPEGARLPSGSTTAGPWPVVSKCALREGRQRERSTQVIPGRSPFGSLLLVDHRLSGLCHSATNEPSANVYLGGETTLYTIHLIAVSRKKYQARGREVEGLTIRRQSRSPRARPRTSISAVAMLLAKGTRFWSQRREM